MAIAPADFQVNLSPTPISGVIGMTTTARLEFSNTSATERGFNLTVEAVLPDGVSLVSSTVNPTLVEPGPDGTIIVQWLNIKDLAPNEVDFTISLTLMADENFRETGLPVPFDIPLVAVEFSGTVDTMPRGDEDIDNEKITKEDSANFIPLRYDLSKTGPGKIPKGAGLLDPQTDPRWPFQYIITVRNNSRLPSTVTLVDNLPNGVRYLGDLSVVGPDQAQLDSPGITTPVPGPDCQDFVTLDWGAVTLSPMSVNEITFQAAVWNNFTADCQENSGSRILHNTAMVNVATLDGESGPVQRNQVTQAMDLTIAKSVASGLTDVGQVNNYTLAWRVNQYDAIQDVQIEDTISVGQTYNTGSAVPAPDMETINPDGTTTLIWNLGLLATGSQGTITFSTTTAQEFEPDEPVSAADTLSNLADIDGENDEFGTAAPDSASVSIRLWEPDISKELLGYFYADGTAKPFTVASPGDEVEFRITYASQGLQAVQRDIEIDEFAPLNMGPLTDDLPVTYGGTLPEPFEPVTVSPNGLRWLLGDVPGDSLWTATFKVPVQDIEFTGSRNNLAKLAGTNTQGLAYSRLDQVEVNFGIPNIQLEKTVTGPDVSAIKAGETYTYSITVSNPQTEDGLTVDAFEMDLTDLVPDDLVFNGNYTISGDGSYDPPQFIGQELNWTILQLAPNQSLTINYEVDVESTVVSGQSYTNQAVLQRPYSQPDREYQYSGDPLTAQTTLRAEGVTMIKQVSPIWAKIGDAVTYSLTVTVPQGTNAYNLQVTDTFPSATQEYLSGTATKDGAPIIPDVINGTVTFPAIDFIDATAQQVTIVYSFDVRITGADLNPPYRDFQTDSATVTWDLDDIGTPAPPFTTTADAEVRVPGLTLNKEQRNVSQGGSFTTSIVDYAVGNIIEYRLTMTNIGLAPAFAIELTDAVNTLLAIDELSFVPSLGNATAVGDTVIWTIDELPEGEAASLKFQVETLPGVAAGQSIPDSADTVYNTNDNPYGIDLGPVSSNTVNLRSPRVVIDKIGDISQAEIGDDILYTITITIPQGTIAYHPKVDDTLPPGQTYIGPATRQKLPDPVQTAEPTVVDQIITFPQEGDIDASTEAVTIIYTFTARITDLPQVPPYQQIQTDSARVRWSLTQGGPLNQTQTDTFSIAVRVPFMTVLKEQRNETRGESYTTGTIQGLPGETVHYRFTLNSQGASPAYSVAFADILSDDLTYDSIVAGPSHGTVTPPPPGPGGTLVWEIDQLDPGSTATLEIAVTINSGIGASAAIDDSFTTDYDSNEPDKNPKTYTSDSNQVTINIPPPGFSKTPSTPTAGIGSIITYTIEVEVPDGVELHNLRIIDLIPAGQEYVAGSWDPGTPSLVDKTLTYQEPVSPVIGPVTLTFTFETEVISGLLTEPYTQTQRNLAELDWDITDVGPAAPPITAHADVDIQVPKIEALKEQRNVTQGGEFTTEPIPGVEVGDLIEYRVTLTNIGTGTAYNLVTTDEIAPELIYQGVVAPAPPGTVESSVDPGDPDGTITWIEEELVPSSSLTLIMEFEVASGAAPGETVLDQTLSDYDTDPDNPTTLGPEASNIVGFDFTLPILEKTVDKNPVFVGETVEYTITLIIPEGTIAYDVQVTDILPPTQSYVPDSLTRNGEPVPSPSLEFPPEGTLTSADTPIVYTFEATVDSLAQTPQDGQTDTAIVEWNIEPGGPAGNPVLDQAIVYAAQLEPVLSKGQRNYTADGPGPFTSEPIFAKPGDVIWYELTIENPSPDYSLYLVELTDLVPEFMSYIGPIAQPPAGIITLENGTVLWTIDNIPPDTSYSAVIALEIQPGAGAGSVLENKLQASYELDLDTPGIRYQTPAVSTQVEIIGLGISKSVSPETVEVGEIFTYTIAVTIPRNTIAYNLILTDTLPAQQLYEHNATLDGEPVFPQVVDQTVIFPALGEVSAGDQDKTLVYTFQARAVVGNTEPPFTQDQTDTAQVSWDVDDAETPAEPVDAEIDVTVTSPLLEILKEQRNVTKETGFVTVGTSAKPGDILEFKFALENVGASPAYHVALTDVLSQFLEYTGVTEITAGEVSYDAPSRTITWEIPEIAQGQEEHLVISVEVLAGVGAGSTSDDTASVLYGTNQQTPVTYGPKDSNTVIQHFPNVRVTKTANPENVMVGLIITYTVTLILPANTVAYNAQFSDSLPVGQVYNGNATLDGEPIEAEAVVGQQVIFPAFEFVSAGGTDTSFVYTFEALVVSAHVDEQSFIQLQTNEARGHWFSDPETQAPPVNDFARVQVTDSSISLIKEQRNVSQAGQFTTEVITAFSHQRIQYRITVTNTGPRAVYEVMVQDYLASQLAFEEPVDVPIGTLVHSGEPQGGTVSWSIPQLDQGQSVSAVFALIILGGTSSVTNYADGTFQVDPENPDRFGNPGSNTVVINLLPRRRGVLL